MGAVHEGVLVRGGGDEEVGQVLVALPVQDPDGRQEHRVAVAEARDEVQQGEQPVPAHADEAEALRLRG